MIVGTAGHIDHGKTALVRALTGIDADRLPEEKRRGITIELGYASLPVEGDEPIGFVDVPGHEKLVRTMVAGASGIDFALLLVAADDGVMPQTVEHLTILSLLGVTRGAAVITKVDRADDALVLQRQREVSALLAGAGLAYDVLAVSAQRGDGVSALRERLLAEAQHTSTSLPKTAGFRMGLDRAFTLDGIGTVVAGSIAAGQVRVGDLLCLAQSPTKTYRVRSLQVHGRSVEQARAGQRCAIGLAGLERTAVERGQTLCDPAIAQTTDRIDVWLNVAATEPARLRSGTLVHLHLSTQEVMATVAVLGQTGIEPGQGALAQLVLQSPVHAWQADRLVLRDASAQRTVAGGAVLDVAGPLRYRQTPERLALLHSQREADLLSRVSGTVLHSPYGLDGAAWLRAAGFSTWPFELTATGAVIDSAGQWLIAPDRLAAHEGAVLAALQAFHTRLPEDIGPDLQRTRRLAAPRMPEGLWVRLVERLVADGRIGRRSGFLHLAGHGEQLRAADRVVAERALPLLREGLFEPPWVRDMALAGKLNEAAVRQVLARLAKTGEVFQVVKDLYYHPAVVQQLADLARDIAARDGQVTAGTFRDATGLGRKRAIQLLEFFDRSGFLRRVGDAHLLRTGTTLFAALPSNKE